MAVERFVTKNAMLFIVWKWLLIDMLPFPVMEGARGTFAKEKNSHREGPLHQFANSQEQS
jgi:hypothetical protein